MSLSLSIVIATRHRPEPLAETLRTIFFQTFSPLEVIIVDSSTDDQTRTCVDRLRGASPCPLLYRAATVPSAAGQRNTGIDMAKGDIVAFLDDDLSLEPDFLEKLMAPFEEDPGQAVGGVSGTLIHSNATEPRGLNRFLLGIVLGDFRSQLSGRVVGPAVNFMPLDIPDTVQRVEWLLSGAVAYRSSVLKRHRFGSEFTGYSFAEDLHLSSRVAKDWILLNTTRARCIHYDLGMHTHRDWFAFGRMVVFNRYLIMSHVLGKSRFGDVVRLFAYEVGYCTVAAVVSSWQNPKRLWNLMQQIAGKAYQFVLLPYRATMPTDNRHA